ncbi:MAG: VCBS repeat-containing protein [Flavobacteriales bacterium]|nr:VCBS repeat-containing protein [Flavobacteriales bacterium]
MKYSLLVLLLWSGTLAAQLEVLNVTPDPFSLTATPETEITIEFNAAMDMATLGNNHFQVFGRWSGPMSGQLSWDNTYTLVTFTPDRPFFSGEWISVMLTHDVLSAEGEPLASGYAYNFWIRSLPGSLILPETEVIEMRMEGEVFIQCYGAYAGDINNDESSDLVVVNEFAEDMRILLNNGDGTFGDFELVPMPGSNKPSPNEGADFDLDGEIDIALGSTQGDQVSVFFGDGVGSFGAESVYTASTGVRGLTVIDFDADGYTDIATANRVGDNVALFTNLGDGTFGEAVFIDTGSADETAAATGDFNNDGIMDIAVATYQGSELFVLRGDGMGNFTVGPPASLNSNPWMIAVGDVDGDGNLDVASALAGTATVSINRGDGTGAFAATEYYAVGDFPLAIDLGDLDGDGDLDFISSNYSSDDFTLYENLGDGAFGNPITYEAYGAGSCAIFHDRNNDGVMDLTGIDEVDDLVILFTNSPIVHDDSFHDAAPSFAVWPNPCTDMLHLSNLSANTGEIRVISTDGRVLMSMAKTGQQNQKLNLSQLSAQVLEVQVLEANSLISKRVIIGF